VDITSCAALTAFAKGKDISWIVNCAAYTAVDKAEDDAETCRRLNTDGPGNIAETARSMGARIIHISTDYVFSGQGITDSQGIRPYRETDDTDPIGVYGLTKRDGENRIAETYREFYILRTAWLYGAFGSNFVSTMLRLMNQKDGITVVNDQRGTPTWARDLAQTIITLIQKADHGMAIPYGIYHFSNQSASAAGITWFDFAQRIYAKGRDLALVTKNCTVNPCASAEYPARVKRPAYSVLDKTKITTALGLPIPRWEESLEAFLEEFRL
jgi:dTDP-4-dehydrorhamnose reductase